MAQAGGKNPEKVPEALKAAGDMLWRCKKILRKKIQTSCYDKNLLNGLCKKIPRQLYYAQFKLGRLGVDYVKVIVKENETLDSALRRLKRSCAKAGIQQEILKESITKNLVFVEEKI